MPSAIVFDDCCQLRVAGRQNLPDMSGDDSRQRRYVQDSNAARQCRRFSERSRESDGNQRAELTRRFDWAPLFRAWSRGFGSTATSWSDSSSSDSVVLAAGSFVARRRPAVVQRRLRDARAVYIPSAQSAPLNKHTANWYRSSMRCPIAVECGWSSVQPTTRYATADATKGVVVGYFVTERVDDSVLGGSEAAKAGWVRSVVPSDCWACLSRWAMVCMARPYADGTYELKSSIANLRKFVTSIVALTLSCPFSCCLNFSAIECRPYETAPFHTLSRVLPFLSSAHLLLDIHGKAPGNLLALTR